MENLNTQLGTFLANFESLDDMVAKGELLHNDRKMSVFFIDHSEGISAPDVDILEYLTKFQEEFVVPMYFSEPGSIQWNYYLLIISEDIGEDIKDLVEKEKSYTRKFILKPDEINRFFSYFKGIGEAVDDIADIWRSILVEHDLDCVFMSNSYTSAVEEVLSGNPLKTEATLPRNTSTSEGKSGTSHLDWLKMSSNYRPFPVQREFNFGRVNLIRGANGSGKTSLIEAIEFAYCGQTRRNWKENQSNPGIEIQFLDSDTSEFVDVNDKERYRARDRDWYGYSANANARRDGIHYRFNIFNFFDADAAYRLSNEEVNFFEVLTRLIAGPEVAVISERISGFHARFTNYLTSSRKEHQYLIDTLNEKETELIELRNSNISTTTSFEALKSFLIKSNLTDKLPDSFESNFEQFEEWLKMVSLMISEVEGHNPHGADPILEGVTKEISNAQAVINGYQKQIGEIDQLQKSASISRNSIHAIEERIRVIELAIRYVIEPRIAEIVGLELRISQLKAKLGVEKERREVFNSKDWKPLLTHTGPTGKVKEELEEAVELKRKDYSAEKNRLNQVRSGLTDLNKIRLEIKELGSKFISLPIESGDCPLCHTSYEVDELKQRILRAVEGVEASLAEGEIVANLTKLESDGKLLKSGLDLLHEFIGLASQWFESEQWSGLSTTQIFEELESRIKEMPQLEAQVLDFEALFSSFRSKNLSEKEYLTLSKDVIALFPSQKLEFGYQMAFEEILKTSKDEVGSLQERARELERSVEGLLSASASMIRLEDFGISPSPDNTSVELIQIHLSKLEKLEGALQKLQKQFPDRAFPFVQKLENEFKEVVYLFDQFRKEMKLENESTIFRKKAEEDNANSRKRITDLAPRIQRCEQALVGLDLIRNDHSQEKYLEDFLSSHRKEIVEIFKDIHAPREFSDLKYENKQVLLLRNSPDKWVDLLEVSTGQRAALAISIMLIGNFASSF